MKLHSLLRSIPNIEYPKENPTITSLQNNHQKVKPGSLFICITGYTFDGHTYAEVAVQSGAVAVLAEKPLELPVPVILVKDTKRAMAILADAFHEHPSQRLRLIGITGTNGKTTTSHLIDSIFASQEVKTGLIGTLYMKVGDSILETKNTTPDSLVLQSVFKHMVMEEVETAIMEVSSHALVQGRVNGCSFDIAVFTNLTQDHLDFHGTMDEYRHAKSLLFSRLGNVYDEERPKYAILNEDDPASSQYKEATSAHIITYGIQKNADFYAENIAIHHSGMSFTLHSPQGNHSVQLKLLGEFNVYNALAALATAYVSNIPVETAIKPLEKAVGVPGRFELVTGGQDFTVVVDYAHTPDGLENVLKTIRQFARKRIFCVVGCGGDRDATKRPIMAQVACKYATDAIFTSDNPRSEKPAAILKDMEKGVVGSNYQIIEDRSEAIHFAIQTANAGDVVLIAGKGHETYQIVGDQVFDFDDRMVALEAINNK